MTPRAATPAMTSVVQVDRPPRMTPPCWGLNAMRGLAPALADDERFEMRRRRRAAVDRPARGELNGTCGNGVTKGKVRDQTIVGRAAKPMISPARRIGNPV